jgi:hypothetical protein
MLKSKEQVLDRLAQEKERLGEMIVEPYNPRQPQLTNIFCICTYIDALKWMLSDDDEE